MSNHEKYSDPTADLAVGLASLPRPVHYPKHGKYRHLQKGAVSVVYICSRFAGKDEEEVKAHILQARRFSRFAYYRQAVPVTPHLLYPQFLRDGNPLERELGIRSGLKLLRRCDELWVFAVDGISTGMRREIQEAEHRKIRVRYFNAELQEVEEHERDL